MCLVGLGSDNVDPFIINFLTGVGSSLAAAAVWERMQHWRIAKCARFVRDIVLVFCLMYFGIIVAILGLYLASFFIVGVLMLRLNEVASKAVFRQLGQDDVDAWLGDLRELYIRERREMPVSKAMARHFWRMSVFWVNCTLRVCSRTFGSRSV